MTDFAQGFLASIRLGNFRAFGGVQTIPFRPITLIYGPNGSGKSSIVEGIRWLRSLALSKSLVDFNRLVRHHDQTSAIQAGVTIELDAAGHENDPIDYFGRLERQIRSVSVDLTFGSKRTTVAKAFAFFRLGDTPHIQYLELKLNEIPLFRLSELETVGDYFSGFGEFSQETLGLDWFNWNHPIVDFLKAETLTLMRARLSEALGQFKHIPPESEFAPTLRSLLTRVETLLNEINAASDSIFEIDTINEFLERLIFQSAGLFPKVELTADDRAARVFRSDHFRLYFPTIVPESLTPEFVANHFRIATRQVYMPGHVNFSSQFHTG